MPVRQSIYEISKKLSQKIDKAGEYWLERYPGWLGNHSGTVEVPQEQSMVYVRLQSGQVVKALNTVAPNIRNWAVYVGRDKSQPHTLRVLEVRWLHNIKDTVNYVLFHHRQHEYPGPDTVFIYRDQFMPLLVFPNGGLTAKMFGDIIYVEGMSNPLKISDAIIDMTSYVPASGAVYVLLEIQQDGTLNYVTGSSYLSREILWLTAPIPPPTSGSLPVCAFIMYAGQTELRRDAVEKTIIDLRMFTSFPSAGSHTHVTNLDDLADVNAPAPTALQVLTWDNVNSEWIAADPTGGAGTMVIEDLTSQIPAVGDHFDLATEAEGEVLLFYNATFQSPDTFTMDVDGLGLTTTFSPAVPDTLWAVHGLGSLTTIPVEDPDALHYSVDNEFAGVTEKVTPVAGDMVLIEDSENGGAKKKVDIDNLGGGGGWEQAFTESGTSFANWTSGGGTWSSDGTQIKQTDTGATWRTAKFNTVQAIAPGYVLEAQIKAVSTGAGALHAVGIIIGYAGTNTSPGLAAELRLESGTRRFLFSRAFTTTLLLINPFTWSDDTFYTLRIISSGGLITAYVDGVLVGTSGNTSGQPADSRYIGLKSYACEAHFKSITGWKLALP